MSTNNSLNLNSVTPLLLVWGGTGANNATSARSNLGAAASGANSDITSLTGLTGAIQAPTFINDTNGNPLLGFGTTASAVNYIELINSVTGQAPEILAAGSDTNINLALFSKGTGIVGIISGATSDQFTFNCGTGYLHRTFFNFANTNQIRTVTFQDATGTLCMDTSSSGSLTTAPPVSASSTLALGTAYQNTLGYDIVLTVYLLVTVTGNSVSLGVGSSVTPTQQIIVTGAVAASPAVIPINIYLPNNYYALLSTSDVAASIAGQIAMPV